MNRIFFTVVYFLVLQNFLWNEVFADSGFSNDFIEQAKSFGINIGKDSDKLEVKLQGLMYTIASDGNETEWQVCITHTS